MTLPHYILRRFVEPGGERQEKRKEFVRVAGICEACDKAVVYRKIMGVEQIDGIWYNGAVYHYQCRQAAGPFLSRRNKVLKGNLEEEEYRFWVGTPEQGMGFSMCRACRTSIYNKLDRDGHFKDPKFSIGGLQCSVRLVNAYKKLSDLTQCLICKKQRFGHTRWGVPICDSPTCESNWKFNQQRWMPLEAELFRNKKRAIFEAKALVVVGEPEIVKAVSYIDTPAGARAWCKLCNMYCDNEGHEFEHTQRLVGGVYEA